MIATRLSSAGLVLGLALAACGGGSGSGSVSEPPVVPPVGPAPPPADQALQALADVGPSPHPAGSAQRGAWEVLQAERVACGFGALAPDDRLDAANDRHQAYLATLSLARSGNAVGHGEVAGDEAAAEFTGTTPEARAQAAGLPAAVWLAELLAADSSLVPPGDPDRFTVDEPYGAAAARGWLGSVYALRSAVLEGKRAGVGLRHQRGTFLAVPTQDYEVVRMGALVASPEAGDTQRLGTGAVASYPCEAATQVKGRYDPTRDEPNPFRDSISLAIRYGTPVHLKSDPGTVLQVDRFDLTAVADGAAIATRQVFYRQESAGLLGPHEFFAVPTTELAAGQRYRVQATGSVDARAWAKDFTFAVRD